MVERAVTAVAGSHQIDTRDYMIESVSRSAPALVPLFRSEQQLRILAELFAPGANELAIGDLARRADVAQATASREVARLAEHGVVLTRSLGRNTLARANWDLPWANDLRSILVQTIGILGQLSEALVDIPGIDSACVFGSWAARYRGEPGPPPHDVDVLVVGSAELSAVRHACRLVEQNVEVDINPVVVSPDEWSAAEPSPFIAQVSAQPLVAIRLG